MKEPKDTNQKNLWNELRVHDLNPDKSKNPDWKEDDKSQNIIYTNLIKYKSYFKESFNFFTDNIEKGGEMPLSVRLI